MQISWQYTRSRVKAQKRPVQERIEDFRETDEPLPAHLAVLEAQRCILCPDAPCMTLGCPLHNKIPLWIEKIARGEFREAAKLSRTTSNMPEACGKLCPQERLCESVCVVGKVGQPIAIGKLEEFANRMARENNWVPPVPKAAAPAAGITLKRVAIVGSGPAGLSAAEELRARGHEVTVFERWPSPGGVLVYGIPAFKFGKERVDFLVERLRTAGVRFECGADAPPAGELLARHGFHAVLLAAGASRGKRPSVPGADLPGVYLATEFLVTNNLAATDRMQGQGRCVVVGGGDTAMDCVRTAARVGFQEVSCVYRRGPEEMPGRAEERENAREEGVRFLYLTDPTAFEAGADGRLAAIRCARMELGAPDGSGRRRPKPMPGSEFRLEAQTAVLAIGYDVEELAVGKTPSGEVVVDANFQTDQPGVFAAGDAVNGADLVVTAVRDGRAAASAMHKYLST